MRKQNLTRTARAFLLALAAAALASPVAKADLEVNGTPNGTYDRNAVMTYDADPTDPTTYSTDQVELGFQSAGSLTVSAGTLTLNGTQWSSFIGRDSGGVGTRRQRRHPELEHHRGGGENSFVIANNNATGFVNLSGGTFNLTSEAFKVGRDGGTGQLNITGGLLASTATTLIFSEGGGTTSGVVLFGAGAGELRLSNLTTLTINNPTTSYFDFTTGSSGVLSINGYTQSQFDDLVTAGSIRVDGVQATAAQFSYADNAGLGTYQLAAVPEPGAIGLLVLGGGVCALFARNRRRSAPLGTHPNQTSARI